MITGIDTNTSTAGRTTVQGPEIVPLSPVRKALVRSPIVSSHSKSTATSPMRIAARLVTAMTRTARPRVGRSSAVDSWSSDVVGLSGGIVEETNRLVRPREGGVDG